MTQSSGSGIVGLERTMRPQVKPGDQIKAKVIAVESHGIHLDHAGLEILVHVTDVDWSDDLSPRDYARVGDQLEVTVLRLTDDGLGATGWLPWPAGHPKSKTKKTVLRGK